MTEQTLTRLWGMRLTFALVVCTILFFHLLPLQVTFDLFPLDRYLRQQYRLVGPDLLLAFACAWSLRRPEYVPSVALAGLFLLADFLLQRPPGLWAMLALLGCEKLKSRARGLRDDGFAGEWLTVCLTLVMITAAYRLVLIITLLEPPPFGLSVVQLVMTMLSYPLVVAVTHWLLGVRKAAPGEYETGGGPT